MTNFLSVGRGAGISGLMTLVPAPTNLDRQTATGRKEFQVDEAPKSFRKTFRSLRMEFWLYLSTVTQERAMKLAVKNDDMSTAMKIADSLVPWVKGEINGGTTIYSP